jgi:hypothetical protein
MPEGEPSGVQIESGKPGLEGANLLGLKTLLTLGHRELHALPFGKAAEAIGLNGGVMDENVLTALALDKTKTFGVVKPLHCSLFH